MTPAPGAAGRTPATALGRLGQLLSCIRFDEVAVLQGTALIGASAAMGTITPAGLLALVGLVAGNVALVAHVFVLNDWAGIEGDQRDPNRATRTFLAKGADRVALGWLALVLLALALALFALAGPMVVAIALAIAALSALYSAPLIHGKGVPVFNSILHILGGNLHFLLGYAAFRPVSGQAIAIGCYFGLVFAAGHLTHEARDQDSDARAGIRTNAVAFGRRRCVLASLALFTLAYALLVALALTGTVPVLLAFAALLYPLHLAATLQALGSGLDFAVLQRLQRRYRQIHAAIGLAMLATIPPWPV